MPSDASAPTTTYRALLRNREFAGLYVSFTLTVAASTLSGFALGTLVDARTGSPFLTAVSMYGATFATVLGAMTLMSVADGNRPRRTLVALQCVSLAGVAAQAVPGLPLTARFALLLVLGFFQSLGTGTRMGLLAEVVPATAYVPARSLMNITSGGTAVLGYALGAVLLRHLTPQEVFLTAAARRIPAWPGAYEMNRASQPTIRPFGTHRFSSRARGPPRDRRVRFVVHVCRRPGRRGGRIEWSRAVAATTASPAPVRAAAVRKTSCGVRWRRSTAPSA